MKIKLSGEGFFLGEQFRKVEWIKQLREEVGSGPIGYEEPVCFLGLRDAKIAADIFQSLVVAQDFSKYSFVVDTDDYPELTNIANVVFEHTKASKLLSPFDPVNMSVKDLLKSAVIKMIDDDFFL